AEGFLGFISKCDDRDNRIRKRTGWAWEAPILSGCSRKEVQVFDQPRGTTGLAAQTCKLGNFSRGSLQ
ncbi:MAG: hypothetical protein M3X11_24800, partial [Acidobacteriota bacterium]|nr:hypothetical protein [Acidobacteriota bacterium]